MNIFISLPAYRDKEVVSTVINAFENALHPNYLTIGILWQYKEDEDINLTDELEKSLDKKYFEKVKILKMDYRRARGPIYARYLIFDRLVTNEKYYLQLDSHSRFSKNWDNEYINILNSLPNFSIISNYPIGYEPDKILMNTEYNNIIEFKNIHEGIPLFKSVQKKLTKPKRNYFWAAGNSFSLTEVFRIVPLDPYLKNLFWGEEFLMAMRFYTHGIRIYTPHENIIYTLWSREYRPLFWELKEIMADKFELYWQCSYIRLKLITSLLSAENVIESEFITKDIDKYGLGNINTASDFLRVTNLDNILKNIIEINEL